MQTKGKGSDPQTIPSTRSFRANLRTLEREVLRLMGEQVSCCGVSMVQCHCLLEVDGRARATPSQDAEA